VLTAPSQVDENGVANRKARLMRMRSKASEFWFAGVIQKPTRAELEEARHHAAHDLEPQEDGHQHLSSGDYSGDYELDGKAADGHQYDGRHSIQGEELRKH
jgi:ubiquinol-cytochrome c reductase cytochrome b subunit